MKISQGGKTIFLNFQGERVRNLKLPIISEEGSHSETSSTGISQGVEENRKFPSGCYEKTTNFRWVSPRNRFLRGLKSLTSSTGGCKSFLEWPSA